MRSEITRLMVEVAVSQGLRELRGQSHRRALRNLVEHGGRYSRGEFQRRLFDMIQNMLRADEHPYYELCSRLSRDVDDRYFLNFGIDLGFESWTKGARVIRRLEEMRQVDVPWLMTVHISDEAGRLMPLETLCALMEQGSAMGIAAYLLVDPVLRTDMLRALCDLYPRCALTALLPDDKLDSAALDDLEGTDNLMLLAARTDDQPFRAGSVIRGHRRPYGLCRTYDAALAETLMVSGDLRCLGDPDCVLPLFRPSADCPQDVADRFDQAMMVLKDQPRQPLFPISLPYDIGRVDEIISSDACDLTVMVDGRVIPSGSAEEMRFPSVSLAEIIDACLRKDRVHS